MARRRRSSPDRPCPSATPSPCPRCCSPRSPTTSAKTGKRASPASATKAFREKPDSQLFAKHFKLTLFEKHSRRRPRKFVRIFSLSAVVPAAGLEPARHFCLGILSPLCLPFHHAGTGFPVNRDSPQCKAPQSSSSDASRTGNRLRSPSQGFIASARRNTSAASPLRSSAISVSA